MTSPIESIQVQCPQCEQEYEDWWRPSINTTLDDFDEDYMQRASTATCPACGAVVELGTLIVGQDGVWQTRG